MDTRKIATILAFAGLSQLNLYGGIFWQSMAFNQERSETNTTTYSAFFQCQVNHGDPPRTSVKLVTFSGHEYPMQSDSFEPHWYAGGTNASSEAELKAAFPDGTYRLVAVYENGSTSSVQTACAIQFPPIPGVLHPENGMLVAPGDRRVILDAIAEPAAISALHYDIRRASDWAWVDGGNHAGWLRSFDIASDLMPETQHRYRIMYDKDTGPDCFCRSQQNILINTDPAIIMPTSTEGASFVFVNRNTFNWYDPVVADAYAFAIADGSNTFTAIADFPTNFSASFSVSVDGTDLGTYGPGERCTFTNTYPGGVSNFLVSGIYPLVDAEDDMAFPIQLEFSSQAASFSMTPTGISEVVDLYNDWQDRNFTASQATNPAVSGLREDPDADSQINWDEFLADTVATNGNSKLQIGGLTASSNAVNITITPTSTNRFYSILSCTNLPTVTWTSGNQNIRASSRATEISVTNEPGSAFFKAAATIEHFTE